MTTDLTTTGQPDGLTTQDADRLRAAVEASKAASTRRAYRGHFGRFADYCAARGAASMPARPEVVAAFLADRFAQGVSPATIRMDAAAVRAAHVEHGQDPPTDHPVVKAAVSGMNRQGQDRGRGQARGLSWRETDTMAAVSANGGGSLAGIRDAALIQVMADTMARASEVVALDVSDVRTDDDGAGTITIRKSKTDQEGKDPSIRYVGASTMARLRAWIDGAGIDGGPVFRQVRKGGRIVGGGRIDTTTVRRIIRKRAEDAGIDPRRVTGHSLRVGGAEELARAGAGLVEIQNAGGWKDPSMPGRYSARQTAAKGAIARLKHGVK